MELTIHCCHFLADATWITCFISEAQFPGLCSGIHNNTYFSYCSDSYMRECMPCAWHTA